MSFDTNRIQVTLGVEAVAGTVETLTASDQDVYWYSSGQASYDIPKESIGDPAMGTFEEGELVSGVQRLSFPDIMADFRHSGDPAVAPKVWGYLGAFGMKVDGTTNKRLYWDATPTCTTLTGNLKTYQCDDAFTMDTLRGGVGTLTIGADGPNSQIKYTLGNLTGFAQDETAGSGRFALTGADTGAIETMADKTCTFGSQVYAVVNWTWEINADIAGEAANNAQGGAKMKHTGQKGTLNALLIAIGPATESLINDNKSNLTKDPVTFAGTNIDIVFDNVQTSEVNKADSEGTLALQISAKMTGMDITLK
ncbi:MAG: hypothetical protein GY775_15070 [Candidatus Scalindua sp.]|jgi:hypothetical protein|nr:hypothetical protein [Candidatus Scalindua sp.]